MELYQQMYYILFHGISDALEALDEARIQDARQLLRAAQQKRRPFRRLRNGRLSLSLLLAVVGLEVHLLDLAHEGVAGVGAGALVVEGLLHHGVQVVQEVLLVHAVLGNGLLHAHGGLQVLNLGDELLDGLGVVLGLDAAETGALGVPGLGVGVLVLGEGAHLGGALGARRSCTPPPG